tara:strand:- start:1218 stop:1901 length:684 start_codon:yes stop_codon:yes gene_type:complete
MKTNITKGFASKTLLLIVVFFGLVYITQSLLLGSSTLVSVGDQASQDDLAASELMLGKNFIEASADPYQQLLQSGANPVGVTFSEEQFSAHIMAMHPISQVTTQFGLDTFEISGTIDRGRLPGFKETLGIKSLKLVPLLSMIEKLAIVDPTFYFSGKGGVYENDVKIELDTAKIGKINVPLEFASKSIENYFELVFRQAPAFSGEDINLQPDFLWFYGTATETVPKY